MRNYYEDGSSTMLDTTFFPHYNTIDASGNPIADVQDQVDIIWERWEVAKDNPNVSRGYKEFLAEQYYISIGILKSLYGMTYVGNDDLSHYKTIANTMKDIEKYPSVGLVNFNIRSFGWHKRPFKNLIEHCTQEEAEKTVWKGGTL